MSPEDQKLAQVFGISSAKAYLALCKTEPAECAVLLARHECITHMPHWNDRNACLDAVTHHLTK